MLNVKVECLDIEQSLNFARTHTLYDGLISIWTRALDDYLTPLQELVPKIITLLNGGIIVYWYSLLLIYLINLFQYLVHEDINIKLGNKILIYLSGCLLGIAYPNRGEIPQRLQDQVRNNIVQFLCSQHSIKAKDDEDIYPYLR